MSIKTARNIIIIALLIDVIACAPKSYSPELKKLYNLNGLSKSVGLLQDAVIGLESQKVITTNEARLVITLCIGMQKVIRDTPNSFKDGILSLLKEYNDMGLLPSTKERLEPLFITINQIVNKL